MAEYNALADTLMSAHRQTCITFSGAGTQALVYQAATELQQRACRGLSHI